MKSAAEEMAGAQLRAWSALLAISGVLPAVLDQQLSADAGVINFEYGILGALLVAPDHTLRMGDLAAALQSPAPRLSKAITRLEKRRLVERSTCASDRRVIHVRLTDGGCHTRLKAMPQQIAFAREIVLSDMTEPELEALAGLLEGILKRLCTNGAR